ncbi:Protein of unknown function [Paenibacillus sp. RU4T]|nr:Protein of unknown function [Paenibacillus sp. RU4X]SIR68158.1 Protein of unknown function [Paenibacillus sp. RU4T]
MDKRKGGGGMAVWMRTGGSQEALAASRVLQAEMELAADREIAREKDEDAVAIGEQQLLSEIAEAHRDWVNAHYHFEQAEGSDQIDYAVYAIEAAQKRYEMLLRQAKRMNANAPAWRKGVPG